MRASLESKVILGLVLVAAGLLFFVVASRSIVGAELLFQSELPRPPEKPNMVKADTGGRIYCGLSQSSVWLEIPPGFTSDWGAEFHCDLTGSLTAWNGTSDALGDRGYLLGLYPATAPILTPLTLVFEIDPARVRDTVAARSYDPAARRWHDLTIEYSRAQQRLRIQIPKRLVASSYPGYADRFLVAVFPMRLPTSPTMTPTPIRAESRPATDTQVPTASAAATLSTRPEASPTGTTRVTATRTVSPTVFSTETVLVSRMPTMTAPSSSSQVPATPSPLPCQASSLLVAMSVVLAVGIHRRGRSAL